MKKLLLILGGLILLLGFSRPAKALIYLKGNSLESMLVRSTVVVTATVTSADLATDTAVAKVVTPLKGKAAGNLMVSNLQIRLTLKDRKPRFAAGDTVVLFLTGDAKAGYAILHSQTLATEADRKAMEGCVAEVLPYAQSFADLDDPHKKIDEKAMHETLVKLVVSKNAFTQILLGRLMGSSLAARMQAESAEDVLFLALLSPRAELKKGALLWVRKFAEIPERILTEVKEIASDPKDEGLAKAAKETLR